MSVIDGLPFADEKKTYILDVLDPILEEMVSDILTEMPKNPLDFMIAWLRKRSGVATSLRVSIQQKNQLLKQELRQVTGSLSEAGTAIHHEHHADEESEEEDDDCDEIPESHQKPMSQMTRARQSVSAEAYGTWNQKKAFTAPVFSKTDEQKERLNQTLQQSFMFSTLESQELNTVILAMKEASFPSGEKVITEGEDGDYLFVIAKGSLDCIKNINGEDKVVKTCVPGDVFGELALLYNCPRAASCVVKEPLIAWQLDRESFNHIVKEASVKRRNRYDNFLKSVTLLKSVDAYERSQISDALKAETFRQGESIVKQDEPGDKFYIIEEGELYAVKNIPGEGEKRVMDYKAGEYFGELALLRNQNRAATIVVASETAKVLSMTRTSFNKMLGPLQNILTRHVADYK